MRKPASKSLTLGQLARACGLARSSLLHYEALGLLAPARRSAAGYRLYGQTEMDRLMMIRRYREAGLSLPVIQELLAERASSPESADSEPARLLESRLLALCREVEHIRAQQKALARLLADPEFRASHRCKGKADWVALLQRAGFDEHDMWLWHRDFEATPEQHAAFLRSLGLAEEEITAIRNWSRTEVR